MEHSLTVLRKGDEYATISTSQEEQTVLIGEGTTIHEKKLLFSHVGINPLQFNRLWSFGEAYYYLRGSEEAVVLRHSASGEVFTVIAEEGRYRSMQEAVAERLGIEVERVSLAWVGELLPQKLIEEYELTEDTELTLAVDNLKRNSFEAEVVSVGRTDTLRFYQFRDDTIKSFEQILINKSLFIDKRKLAIKTTDSRTTEIEKGSSLLQHREEKLRLFCVSPGAIYLNGSVLYSGQPVQVVVPRAATSLEVKAEVERETGIGVKYQRLLYLGAELTQFTVTEETIEVVVETVGNFVVVVQTSGEKVSLDTEFGVTIGDFKTMVQEKIGIVTEEQRLFYNDVLLEDSQTLNSCGICTASIILLLTRNDLRLYVKSPVYLPTPFYQAKNHTIKHLIEAAKPKVYSPLKTLRVLGSFELSDTRNLSAFQTSLGHFYFELRISGIEEDDIVAFVKDSPSLPKPLWIRRTQTVGEVKEAVGVVGKA